MANLNLPPNVKQDPNTGLYFITNSQGKTVRVNADSQSQLDQYVKSVDTGVPTTVTTTDSDGNPRQRTFDSNAIINQTDSINNQNRLMTATKRQAGVLGNADGSYQDVRTGQTITQEEAAAKIKAAGLPPDALTAVTPKNSPAYGAAQATVNSTTNAPSNLAGNNAESAPQAQGGNSTDKTVTDSVPAPATSAITPATSTAAPLAAQSSQGATDSRIDATSTIAPADAQTAQDVADLRIAAESATGPAGDEALAAFDAAQDAELNARLDRAGDVPLTDEDAALLAQETADLQVAAESANPVSPLDTGYISDAEQAAQADAAFNARLDRAAAVDLANSGDEAAESAAREKEAADLRIAAESATPVDGALVSALDPNEFGAQAVAGDADTAEASNAASQAAVGTGLAQKQAVLAAQKKMANNGDWRVRLSLAPGATYLYNASPPGILQPLAATDGVVFPYMPKIDTNYKAEYDTYNLTHSNYRGYFYKSSYTDAVNLTATFTAQDSSEADYLLAVIHFFKSITKMFYGQDAERGAPPPLVYLTGLGQYQFSAHPCVVNNFQLNLPNDVDYIRARSVNINGANLLTRRNKQDLPTNPVSGAVQRLQNLFSSQKINKGAIDSRPAPPTLGLNQPTYVPTKMDISLTLYPIQSRQQVSRQFSLKGYANGDLLKGGFW